MLKLVEISREYEKQLIDMMDEWKANGEKIVPMGIDRSDYHHIDEYIKYQETVELEPKPNHVPASTYFALDTERNIFVGAVNIRHYLNESLLFNGGHIGDGVRPSERRKHYATQMIALALDICKDFKIDRVLMCCHKDNIGSAKSIQNNGGVLENEIIVDGKVEQRYWIDLNK